MAGISARDFLGEVRFDIKENDLIKARAAFSFIGEVDKETQKSAVDELKKADDAFVVPLLAGILANIPKTIK